MWTTQTIGIYDFECVFLCCFGKRENSAQMIMIIIMIVIIIVVVNIVYTVHTYSFVRAHTHNQPKPNLSNQNTYIVYHSSLSTHHYWLFIYWWDIKEIREFSLAFDYLFFSVVKKMVMRNYLAIMEKNFLFSLAKFSVAERIFRYLRYWEPGLNAATGSWA